MRNLIIVLLTLFALVSCQTLTIPDIEICIKKPVDSLCSHTVSGGRRVATDDELLTTKNVIMKAEAYGEIKKFILKACEMDGSCEKKDLLQSIDNFETETTDGGWNDEWDDY